MMVDTDSGRPEPMADSTPAARSPPSVMHGLVPGMTRRRHDTNGIDFRLMERLRPISSPRPTSRGPTMAPDAAAAGGEQVQPLKLPPGPRPGPGSGAGATVGAAPLSVPVNDRWHEPRTETVGTGRPRRNPPAAHFLQRRHLIAEAGEVDVDAAGFRVFAAEGDFGRGCMHGLAFHGVGRKILRRHADAPAGREVAGRAIRIRRNRSDGGR